jgi:hypothetical protein
VSTPDKRFGTNEINALCVVVQTRLVMIGCREGGDIKRGCRKLGLVDGPCPVSFAPNASGQVTR